MYRCQHVPVCTAPSLTHHDRGMPHTTTALLLYRRQNSQRQHRRRFVGRLIPRSISMDAVCHAKREVRVT